MANEQRTLPVGQTVHSSLCSYRVRASGSEIVLEHLYFRRALDKNCTVTLRPIGNGLELSSNSITASRMSRSLLSDGSPVVMLFLPIIADILATEPRSFFPSRASAWIITFCPTESLSTSLSSTSALMCRVEVSARLNKGRGVTVLKDSPRRA